jgi:hypothetical protein
MENQYYSPISPVDYEARKENNPEDEFTYYEIHQLNKFRPSQRGSSSDVTIFKNDRTFFVYKRTDEWFLVKYHFSMRPFDFYECDQFEGLLKFLEDKTN